MSAHKPLLSIVRGGGRRGGGGGSVQLLTGGRRVSQASPTLSLVILEPLVTVAIRQSLNEFRDSPSTLKVML